MRSHKSFTPNSDMLVSRPSIARIASRKLFAGLDEDALREVLNAATERHMPAKKNVTECGQRPHSLFLLREGRARSYILTESGSEVVILWLVPGDVIGLVSLLPNPPTYIASASTVSACEFLVWERDTVRRLAKAHPQLMENGFRLALQYVGTYMKRHAATVSKDARARLAQALLHLANNAGEVESRGVSIDITNEQLSSFSDISPFTASRLLSRWEREGALQKTRGRITLLAPEFLMIA